MKKLFIFCTLMLIVCMVDAKKKSFGNGLFWEVTSSGELIISGNGAIPNYRFAIRYKGKESAPWNQKSVYEKVHTIIIEEGITEVGDNAFNTVSYTYKSKYKTSHVKKVVLPNSLKRIGSNAFAYTLIEEIDIPKSVREFGRSAFWATKIKCFEIPSTWEIIPERIFSGCSSLEKVTIPEGVKEIGQYAFCDTNLKEVKLPNSLIKIGEGCFMGSKLEIIEFPSILEEIGTSSFQNCKLSKLWMPNSVKKIGNKAFYNCPLDEVYIPQNTEVGEDFLGKDKSPYYFKGIIYSLPQEITKSNHRRYGIDEYALWRYERGENGIYNSQGKIILSPKAEQLVERKKSEQNGRIYYEVKDIKKNDHGILSENGVWIVPMSGGYQYIKETPKDGITFYLVIKGEYFKKYGLIREDGKVILPTDYDFIDASSDNFIFYVVNSNKGVMTYEGETIIPTSRGYTYISKFVANEGIFHYSMSGYKGTCDKNGKELTREKNLNSSKANSKDIKSTSTNKNKESSLLYKGKYKLYSQGKNIKTGKITENDLYNTTSEIIIYKDSLIFKGNKYKFDKIKDNKRIYTYMLDGDKFIALLMGDPFMYEEFICEVDDKYNIKYYEHFCPGLTGEDITTEYKLEKK